MSSDGHHIGVMTGKAWAFGVILVAVLTVRVCGTECMEYDCRSCIEGNLLHDHYLIIKNFTAPGETDQEEHTFLSIIVMMCSSLKENKEFYTEKTTSKSDHFEKLIWAYVEFLSKWAKCDHNLNDMLKFCEKYNCSHSYNTSYVTPNQFCDMYEKVNPTTSVPVCPKPLSNSTPTMHTSTSSSSSSSSTSTSTSSSDSYTTTPAVSEYTSTPAPSFTTITHNTTTENITSTNGTKGPEKLSTEQIKDLQSLLLAVCLVASVMLNVILIVHCKKKQRRTFYPNPVQEQSDTNGESLNWGILENQVQLELKDQGII